ncbi:uncharacterized protein MONOS_13656 [Monocercomonoides exilis]|uniref:uncharacterized protein n=1 Tax=Monocercomonoides exilis TaxID=2049356 RepID=UPI003559BAF9|nr:hypothetical protein MONOS_13656 [Monocercomonoides exilis]|eukprot:MONOS_13656.1-p1 / transcript=MONOS_13656.1 / gene=MONOS_13656 / organism=Monocercomonoides_exilis_PA203 / gene_product=unspecified product / transcript_product=unspecified product / location=Mono_scaffold00859:9411-10541(+) / protein_length=332 / sequence_SO=supercontig / SO=protein_coding / is_pseudo=false
MVEFTETLSNTNLSNGVIHQTVRKVLDSINLFRETKIDVKDIEIFPKTYVGDKPRRGKRYKSMWDLTIITKWAESTYDAKDIRTLQRRALILTMIFVALRPAELERLRRETTLFKENTMLTQIQTKNERQPANLQRIKEELTAILRENGISDTFTAFSIRHAVITHFARQQDADWKAINAYARWELGLRVDQEYYTVLPVQDTRWILETIGGSVLQRGEDYKPDKSGDTKEGTLEIADADMKDRTEELPNAVFEEGKKPTRKLSKKGRKKLPSGEVNRGEMAHSRSPTPRQQSRQKTPSIIPNNVCDLTGEKDSTPLKKRGKDRRKRSGRS